MPGKIFRERKAVKEEDKIEWVPSNGHHLDLLAQAGSPEVIMGYLIFLESLQGLIRWRLIVSTCTLNGVKSRTQFWLIYDQELFHNNYGDSKLED